LQQDIQKAVGQRIKAIRERKGITQDQLAEMTGLNRVHLYRLETGRQSMTLRTLKLIADTLDVRARDLIGRM
jgi:transcriptional regulator with XRE-family HTH domain